MGCTHSKNSKSKTKPGKSNELQDKPLENDSNVKNKVAHFDKAKSNESDINEDTTQPNYSRNILNESRNTQPSQKPIVTIEEKAKLNKPKDDEQERDNLKKPLNLKKQNSPPRKSEFGKTQQVYPAKSNDEPRCPQKRTSPPPPAAAPYVPLTVAPPVHIASQYYPMNEQPKQEQRQSPEKPLKRNVSMDKAAQPKRQKEVVKESAIVLAPPYRPQLTADDMEAIRKSVQQRNERRAYMMTHRNETDDTLYELEHRMPEKDYTGRIEKSNMKAY